MGVGQGGGGGTNAHLAFFNFGPPPMIIWGFSHDPPYFEGAESIAQGFGGSWDT